MNDCNKPSQNHFSLYTEHNIESDSVQIAMSHKHYCAHPAP